MIGYAVGPLALLTAVVTFSPAQATQEPAVSSVTEIRHSLVEEHADMLTALQDARDAGYVPCEPRLYEIDPLVNPHAAAEAAFPEWFRECAIGSLPNLEPAGYRLHVMRHEVCHLVTGPTIAAKVDAGLIDQTTDYFHADADFEDCLIRLDGKVSPA